MTDLSAQVRCLLKEVEVLRGNCVADEDAASPTSDEDDAVAFVDPHLITFRNIDELQHKNQQLLHILRQVSEQQDEVNRKAFRSELKIFKGHIIARLVVKGSITDLGLYLSS